MKQPTFSSARYFVSQDFFEIATASIAALSNSRQKFQSLRSVIEATCELMEISDYDAEHFHTFIATSKVKGSIQIYLKLPMGVIEKLNSHKAKLAEISGIPVYDRTALAYFMSIALDKKLY
jgi:hypothetical protein